MRVLVLVCCLLFPQVAWAGVGCDGLDDTITTGVNITSFLAAGAGTIMATVLNDGTITASGACGTDRVIGTYDNTKVLSMASTPTWSARIDIGGSKCAVGTLTANTWTHVTWRHDGSNIDLFVNGVLTQSTAAAGTSSPAQPVHACGSNTIFSKITMDHALFYNVVVDTTAIAAVGKSRVKDLWTGSPTARWDFECPHGTAGNNVVIPDRTSNNRAFTINDGANNTGATCAASSGMTGAWGAF